MDGRGLAELFGDRPLYVYPLRQAIEDGVLCRLTQYAVETGASVDGVSSRLGDFATGELSRAVNTPARNRVVVETFQKYASTRRAVAFCVDVQHAHDLAACFTKSGVDTAVVHGSMPIDERRNTLRRFRAGKIRVVCNCMVLTEGFDDPAVSAVLMARPTKSRSLYTQAVGRGLRRHDGKADCLIVDYVDNSRRHKLVTVLDLFGTPRIRNADGGDVVEVVDRDVAEQEVRREIESVTPLSWSLKRVCPWPQLPTLRDYVPTTWWHGQSASHKQLKFLRQIGLKISRSLKKGEASYLIDRALEYRAAYPRPATDKQCWFLWSVGQWREGMTCDEARQLIDRLKAAK